MKKRSKKLIFFLLISFVFSSCVTVPYQKIDSFVAQAQYHEALKTIEESKKKGYKKKDALLFYLEAGMLAHYAKEFSKSTKFFDVALQRIEASVTKSISREATSFILNDRIKEYTGEDYENFYVNFFNALNYFFLSSYESAMVEIRRLQNKVKHLKNKYGEDILKIKKQIAQKNKSVSYNDKIKTSKFFDSALAQYLSLLFYRSQYLYDDMHLSLKAIEETFAKNKTIYNFPLPNSIQEEFHLKKGQARLNCFAFYGLSPIKKQEVLRLPLPPANWIKIALPKLVERPSQVARVELVLEKKTTNSNKESTKKYSPEENEKDEQVIKDTIAQTKNFEPIENISAVAMDTFQNRASLIYLKTILRSLAKSATAAILTHQSLQKNEQQSYPKYPNKYNDQNKDDGNVQERHNSQSQNDGLLLGLFGLFTQLFAELSEQADLRISRYFPSMATVASITVKPGIYNFTIKYYNSANEIVFRETFAEQQLASEQLNLCESYFLQ